MAKKKEPAYAEAIAEIEKIRARFRSEEMDVDSLAAEVKRATELIAACTKQKRRYRRFWNDDEETDQMDA